jgi:hypothetical protein
VLHGAATRSPEFRALLEAGLAEEPSDEPPLPTLDHPDAAVPARRIVRAIGPVAARTAFFLGAVELAGLAPGQLPRVLDGTDTRPFAAPVDDAASMISPDAQDHVDQLVPILVLRHRLRERCGHLLAYRRDHAPDAIIRPDHPDHAQAVRARAEAVAFREVLPRLRRALGDLPDTAQKLELTTVFDELERWTLVFVLSFPPSRAQ